MHEVWECKNHEQETVFFRVVNTFITVKKVYLFYYDGVTFKRESLPDGKTVLLHIIEETFYESKDDEISKKYVGEFKLVTEVDRVVDRLFPINTQGRPAATSTRAGAPPRPRQPQAKSLSMAAMAVYAYTKTKAETDPTTGKDVEQYSARKFNTTIVKDGHRILQIGTPWEEELSSTASATLKCFLDTNTKAFYGLRYLPRVVEFIEDNVYELDEEDFFEMFEVTEQKVYLCTNDVHKIVRVKTTFRPNTLTLAIRHTDAVKLNINGNAGDYEYSLGDIMEVIYINALNSKVVKYDGRFSFPTPTNAQAQAQRTGNRAGRGRGFLSRVFSGSCLGGCSQPQD
ncbi:uncharacterized protein LOC111054601 [Nilaparvata lugens]|uniref:uncharacterized protein LOC111054601 n=1 Tax=Nilaparvata lugens TaxID=108931 RepID=UPI00193E0945|nr:uncharacterized protein LOC111054601 [Nilaparvata lugens]